MILRELRDVLQRGVAGDVVELGCYMGDTSLLLAKELAGTKRGLWLYDSFDGLPEKTIQDLSSAGEAFRAGELKASKSALVRRFMKTGLPRPMVKKAWFADLGPADLPGKIAFAFLDGDYYESIRDSLRLIERKLSPGAVIVVDDYQSEALPGVAKAVDGWLGTGYSKVLKLRVERSLAVVKIEGDGGD